MAFDMHGYEDVQARLDRFLGKFPEGSVRTVSWAVTELPGGVHGIAVECEAYRTPDDHRPGNGWSLEPFPGHTPYTRGSELENAETSARGRAINAVLMSKDGRGASQSEVAARHTEPPTEEPRATAKRPTRKPKNAPDPPQSGSSVGPPPPTPQQYRYLHKLLLAQGFSSDKSKHAQASAILGRDVESLTSLTMREAHQMIDAMKQPKAERVGAGPYGEPPEDPYAQEPLL